MNLVKKANNKNFKDIEDIGKESLPIYYTVSDLIMLEMTKHLILKLTNDKEIIGFAVCRETLDNIHILSIAIKKANRKEGLGTKILDFIKSKNKNISLYVHTINDVALSFYKKNSFIISDILFGYYETFEDEKDAYKMICKNINSTINSNCES